MSSTASADPTATGAPPPPQHQKLITDTDKAPLIEVLTLMFLVLALLSCFVRTGTKIYKIKTVKFDDILAIIATLFAVAQSVVVLQGAGSGLGQLFASLNDAQRDKFFKTEYAAQILFILTIATAKVSGAMSIHSMAQQRQKLYIRACEIFCAVWGLSSVLVVAFQCKLPTPWNYSASNTCINVSAFWTYFSILNILTDFLIIALMINNVRHIQTSSGKKALVMGVFGSRILVTPAAIAQIYLQDRASRSSDYSFAVWDATIAIQLVQCLAIFTVCIPNLKPFLDSLESGQIRIDDMRRQGRSDTSYPGYRPGYAGYKDAQHSGTGRSRRNNTNGNVDTLASGHSDVHEMTNIPKSRNGHTAAHGEEPPWDGRSHTSQSSQTILIQQTKTWHVDVETKPNPLADGTGRPL